MRGALKFSAVMFPGHWVLYPFALEETLEFGSLGFHCPVAEIFEDVEGE
jgi:hypothetical protein